MTKPLTVGITGGIGGGKSTFARLLRERGYHVYDTDAAAKRLQNEDAGIRRKLMEKFGEQIYTAEGLNRKLLAEKVFAQPRLLKWLNGVVHPVVEQDFQQWKAGYSHERLLFVESAILYESGFDKLVDKVVLVTASEEIRIGRVMKRDGISQEAAKQRMANQLPENVKVAKANIVIYNESKTALSDNLEAVLGQLKASL